MRVLIVDDHVFVRLGIRSVLAESAGFEVCGEAADGRDAIEKAKQLKPDAIIMDVSMPEVNGIDATKEIRSNLPNTRILILSQHNSLEAMRRSLHAGASGYLVKSTVSQQLVPALLRIRDGKTYFDPALFKHLSTASRNIDTEEVLRLVTSSMSAAVTLCTQDFRYLWANESYARWMQCPVEDIIGQSIEGVIGPEAFSSLHKYFARVLSGEKVTYEEKVTFKGIGPRWILANYTPTFEAAGAATGWVAVVLDITERKQMEEALLQTKAQLAEEVASLADLNDVSARLWNSQSLKEGLDEMLDAAIGLMGADKGNVQILQARRSVLTIEAQRGFEKGFVDFFAQVTADDDTACGRAWLSSLLLTRTASRFFSMPLSVSDSEMGHRGHPLQCPRLPSVRRSAM